MKLKGSKQKMQKELTRKQRERRNTLRNLVIAFLVAVILVVALFSLQNAVVTKEEVTQIYRVASDVERDVYISEDNFDKYFNLVEVQTTTLPDGYITDKAEIIGKYLNQPYKAKQIITKDALSDKKNVYMNSIEDPVTLALNVGELGSVVSGTIREGDYVNIYGMKREAVGNTNTSGIVQYYGSNNEEYKVQDKYTFKHVLIGQSFNGSGEHLGTENDGAATMFNITISEKDAEKFSQMIANCEIRIAKVEYIDDAEYIGYVEDDENEEPAVIPAVEAVGTGTETGEAAESGETTESEEAAESTEGGNTITSGITSFDDGTVIGDVEKANEQYQELIGN